MRDLSLNQFLEVLASKAAVPGGGGAAALGGALGAALGSMVCGLTEGKKKYAEYQDEIIEIMAQIKMLQERLASLIEEDAAAFEPLSQAYGLPKDTPQQLEYRDTVMAKALEEASKVPLAICEVACEVIVLQERLAEIGSRIAISDVGVGVLFCRTALQSGALNVYINTKLMKNREMAQQYDGRVQALLEEYIPRADRVYEKVLAAVQG